MSQQQPFEPKVYVPRARTRPSLLTKEAEQLGLHRQGQPAQERGPNYILVGDELDDPNSPVYAPVVLPGSQNEPVNLPPTQHGFNPIIHQQNPEPNPFAPQPPPSQDRQPANPSGVPVQTQTKPLAGTRQQPVGVKKTPANPDVVDLEDSQEKSISSDIVGNVVKLEDDSSSRHSSKSDQRAAKKRNQATIMAIEEHHNGYNKTYKSANITSRLLKQETKPAPNFAFANDVPRDPPMSTLERAYYSQMRPRQIREFDIETCKAISWMVYWSNGGGNCYWIALAQILCGAEEYWPWVKASHKIWYEYVLGNKNHPRHELYLELEDLAESAKRKNSVVLNMANMWTAASTMGQVTADLYDIFLVIFNDDDKPVRPDMYGCLNATQRFLRYSQNHFEPVVPLIARPSEWHFPVNSIKKFIGISGHVKSLDSMLRRKTGFIVPEQLLPRPALPRPTTADLRIVTGKKLPWKEVLPAKRKQPRDEGVSGNAPGGELPLPPMGWKTQRTGKKPRFVYPYPGISTPSFPGGYP